MGRFRTGRRDHHEHAAVHVDIHGADEQRAISVGGGKQGRAAGRGYRGGEGAGGEMELVTFYTIVATFDRGDYGDGRDAGEIGTRNEPTLDFSYYPQSHLKFHNERSLPVRRALVQFRLTPGYGATAEIPQACADLVSFQSVEARK